MNTEIRNSDKPSEAVEKIKNMLRERFQSAADRRRCIRMAQSYQFHEHAY